MTDTDKQLKRWRVKMALHDIAILIFWSAIALTLTGIGLVVALWAVMP